MNSSARPIPQTRLHSNGFQVIIDRHPTKPGWWSLHTIARSEGARLKSLELMAPTLAVAKELADRLAVVNHACTDQCKDWVMF
jgi:hypothetical protein